MSQILKVSYHLEYSIKYGLIIKMEAFNGSTHPPESDLPSYMVPFDSEHPLPEYQEQLEATATLRGALEAKVLDTIHGLSSTSANAGVYASLSLESADHHGNPVEIEIESADTDAHPNLPPYVVVLSEGPRDTNSRFTRKHHYTVPVVHSDEGATRRDVSAIAIKKIDVPRFSKGDKPLTISPQGVDKIIDAFRLAEERQREEKDLGLNDQPIGLKEAQAVGAMITKGQLKVTEPKNTK
jgi:hypothetical protein